MVFYAGAGALAAKQAVAPDFRGFGRSSADAGGRRLNGLAMPDLFHFWRGLPWMRSDDRRCDAAPRQLAFGRPNACVCTAAAAPIGIHAGCSRVAGGSLAPIIRPRCTSGESNGNNSNRHCRNDVLLAAAAFRLYLRGEIS